MFFFFQQVDDEMLLRITTLQNNPYFCVVKYARAVKQKVGNEAENSERDWDAKSTSLSLHTACEARAQDSYATLYLFFNWFWEKKPDCFAV